MMTFIYELLDFDPSRQDQYAEALSASDVTHGLLEGVIDADSSQEARDRLMARLDAAGLETGRVVLCIDRLESEV